MRTIEVLGLQGERFYKEFITTHFTYGKNTWN